MARAARVGEGGAALAGRVVVKAPLADGGRVGRVEAAVAARAGGQEARVDLD